MLDASRRAAGANWPPGGFDGGNLLFLFCSSELRPRYQACESYRVSILQVGVDGGHDHARLYSNEIDADERNAYPGVNYDTFVQYAVEYVDQARTAGNSFNC